MHEMIGVRVEGGTGAGRKRALKEKPHDWTCNCLIEVKYVTADGSPLAGRVGEGAVLQETRAQRPGFLVRCPYCGTQRPA